MIFIRCYYKISNSNRPKERFMIIFLKFMFFVIHLHCCFVGMVTAGFCILFMKIKVEWHSIIFCSIGAFFGLIFGKYYNFLNWFKHPILQIAICKDKFQCEKVIKNFEILKFWIELPKQLKDLYNFLDR